MTHFCIYIKDEKDQYTIRISERGEPLFFDTKEDAYAFADKMGLKSYTVKYSD